MSRENLIYTLVQDLLELVLSPYLSMTWKVNVYVLQVHLWTAVRIHDVQWCTMRLANWSFLVAAIAVFFRCVLLLGVVRT